MNNLNTVASFIIPTPICDVGMGIYHILKGDVTQEQCEKLVSGGVRIAAVAAMVLAGATLTIFCSAEVITFALNATVAVSSFLDWQTTVLFLTSSGLIMGISGLAMTISNITKGVFTNFGMLGGGGLFCILSSVAADKMGYNQGGWLGEEINNKCKIWGADLFLKLKTSKQ